MAKHRFVRFLHSEKESNDDIVERFKEDTLRYVGYEEEIVYEYDDVTKQCKVIGIDGKFLSDEVMYPEDITGE